MNGFGEAFYRFNVYIKYDKIIRLGILLLRIIRNEKTLSDGNERYVDTCGCPFFFLLCLNEKSMAVVLSFFICLLLPKK